MSQSWAATRTRERAERTPPKKPGFPPAQSFWVSACWLVRCPLGYYVAVTDRAFISAVIYALCACWWLYDTQRWLRWRAWARWHKTALPGPWTPRWWNYLLGSVAVYGITESTVRIVAGAVR